MLDSIVEFYRAFIFSKNEISHLVLESIKSLVVIFHFFVVVGIALLIVTLIFCNYFIFFPLSNKNYNKKSIQIFKMLFHSQ